MSGPGAHWPAALRRHWPEYLMEGAELGLFMVSACTFGILLFHPSSPVAGGIDSPALRRLLMGLAMGATLVALVYSPIGKRSGAHMNPAVTLTFWRLGRVGTADAAFYVLAQFTGGAAGVLLVGAAARAALAHEQVNYVMTLPAAGPAAAWAAEFTIAMLLMLTVLTVSNTRALSRYTGLFAGAMVATYIVVEEPLSGMSMNPARTLGSALSGGRFDGLWIYFTAPPLGMLAASLVYVRLVGSRRVFCAKLHHHNSQRCIFRCRFHELLGDATG